MQTDFFGFVEKQTYIFTEIKIIYFLLEATLSYSQNVTTI